MRTIKTYSKRAPFYNALIRTLGESQKGVRRTRRGPLNGFMDFFTCRESTLGVYKTNTFFLAPESIGVFNPREEALMSCLLCGSGNQAELTAEMIIHFSGLKNLVKPGVWVFPTLLVCLDCGCSHFTVPER